MDTTKRRWKQEQGSALILVMIFGMIIMGMVLVLASLTHEVSSESTRQTVYQDALGSAQIGMAKASTDSQAILVAQGDELTGYFETLPEEVDFYTRRDDGYANGMNYTVQVRSAYYAHHPDNPTQVSENFLMPISKADRESISNPVYDVYEITVANEETPGEGYVRGVQQIVELRKDPIEIPGALNLRNDNEGTPNVIDFDGNNFRVTGENHSRIAQSNEHPSAALFMPMDGKLKVVFQGSEAALDSSFWMINPFTDQEEVLLPTNHPKNLLIESLKNDTAEQLKALTHWTGMYKAGEQLVFFARVDAVPWGRGIYDHYCVGHFDPWFTEDDAQARKMSYCSITLWRKKDPSLPDGDPDSYELLDGLPASSSNYYKRGGFSVYKDTSSPLRPHLTEEELQNPEIRRITYGVEDLKGRWWVDWDHDDIVVDVYILPPESNGGVVDTGTATVSASFVTTPVEAANKEVVLTSDKSIVKATLRFDDGTEAVWPDEMGGGMALGGEVNINPSNNDQFEFTMVLPDDTVVTRDDLLAGSSYTYTGPIKHIRFKPKGNGNQNGITVNGAAYDLENKYIYTITGTDLSGSLANRNNNGTAMGKWWVENLTANDCTILIEKPGTGGDVEASEVTLRGAGPHVNKIITDVWVQTGALAGVASTVTETYTTDFYGTDQKVALKNPATKMGLPADGASTETYAITVQGTTAQEIRFKTTVAGSAVNTYYSEVGQSQVDPNGFRVTLHSIENATYTFTVENVQNTQPLEWVLADFGSSATIKKVNGSVVKNNGDEVSVDRQMSASGTTDAPNNFSDYVLDDPDGDGKGTPVAKGERVSNENLVELISMTRRPNEENFLVDEPDTNVYSIVVGGTPSGTSESNKVQNVIGLQSKQTSVFMTYDEEGELMLQENAGAVMDVNMEAIAEAFVGELDDPKETVTVLDAITNETNLGNDDEYVSAYVNGDIVIPAEVDIEGAGILVVNGDLTVRGKLAYKGIILVLGDLDMDSTLAGKDTFVNGAVLVTENVHLDGKVEIWYSKDAIDHAWTNCNAAMQVKAIPRGARILEKSELEALGLSE